MCVPVDQNKNTALHPIGKKKGKKKKKKKKKIDRARTIKKNSSKQRKLDFPF